CLIIKQVIQSRGSNLDEIYCPKWVNSGRSSTRKVVKALQSHDKTTFDAALFVLEHVYGAPLTLPVSPQLQQLFDNSLNKSSLGGRRDFPLHRVMNLPTPEMRVKAVTALLNLGANPLQRNYARPMETPFQLAIRRQHAEVVTIFLNRVFPAEALIAQVQIPKMVLNAPFLGASSAMLWAINAPLLLQRESVIRALAAAGASTEVRDAASYDTPLQQAVRSGSVEMVSLLLQLGADTSARTLIGADILTLASQSPNREAIEAALRTHLEVAAQPDVTPGGQS
ncbi:ankyrin repeat protein, partial [Actimicrobium sp. GrIS 1.19]|uniref:ankyrin repeat domain-containing protein n=1 Tax=Actimicrobium sp. GrIS 1.19 TaxID=3071708 RepID=UPI002DFBFA66|nr:ankyrin repeat protein [Actimicrobium sp. GrIS 1.19]